MTASAKPSSKHHRIRSLEVTGGFLQGIKMDFRDGLNCVIGGRGTGKTTVLEALRFALDRMPNETVDRKRYEALEKLLEANLGTGSIKLELETADGTMYSVSRAFGETPPSPTQMESPSTSASATTCIVALTSIARNLVPLRGNRATT